MNIGILGAGKMTHALGKHLVKKGHNLLVSYSGDPAKLEKAAQDNDAGAKGKVGPVFEALDVEPVDAGPLYAARFIEPTMFLLVHLSYGQKFGAVGTRLLRR